MSDFQKCQGEETEWNDARLRVRNYLEALHISKPEAQERIISAVLKNAAAKHQVSPLESPTTLAINEIHILTEQWFERLLGAGERSSVSGLISWFAMDATEQWQAAFLAEELPDEFHRSLRECAVRAAPGMKVSSMVPQPFPNPLEAALNLPTNLEELAREVAPLVAKISTVVVSAFATFSGIRFR